VISIDLRTGAVMQHRFSNDYNLRILAKDTRFGFSDDPDEEEIGMVSVEKPTFVVGNIVDAFVGSGEEDDDLEDEEEEEGRMVAMCFGGRLRLERFYLQQVDKSLFGFELFNQLAWQEYQTRQWFALQALDINQDGSDEIVSCAWDGLTCIYDLDNNVVRFQFEERVQAFLAGRYTHGYASQAPGGGGEDDCSTGPRTNVCFIYVTLSGSIVIYTGVNECIRSIPALTLLDVLRQRGQLEHVLKRLDSSRSSSRSGMMHMDEIYCARLLHHALYELSPQIKVNNAPTSSDSGAAAKLREGEE